ncbi:MAG: MopE-related protein [Myxococcota bacterium]
MVRLRSIGWACVVAAAVAAAGCNDSEVTGEAGSGVDDASADGRDAPDTPTYDVPTGTDLGPGQDAEQNLPEDFGEPCEDNEECLSGFCVQGPDGDVCTKLCSEQCPEGYHCKGVQDAGPDVVFLCLPSLEELCTPCEEDAHCGGGACLSIDGSSRCAPPCETQEDCPSGYSCAPDAEGAHEGQWCQPDTGSCTCNGATNGGQRTCTVGNELGTCMGVETCDPEQGWTGCTATAPTDEICDGVDNDCNGLVDDGLNEGTSCENTVAGVGTCTGNRFCLGTEGWICQAPTPEPELCDFKDNDCDGEIDEDFKTGDAYTAYDHCGTCNVSCGTGFPNAAATFCNEDANPPRCEITGCAPGYTSLNQFQCIPEGASLCQPCSDDEGCLGEDSVCVQLQEGGFCGQGCDDVSDCPSGYDCEPIGGADSKQCVPSSGSCSCTGDNTGLSRACVETWTPQDPGQPAYTCTGSESCTATGWGECELPEEDCDNVDNDCDGEIDEDFRDADGDYTTLEHCGGCGISCLALSHPHAEATCDDSGAVPQCSYACTDGWVDVDGQADNGCECLPQAGEDLPDADGVDSDCDGIDGEMDAGLFVSKAGDDANPGTLELPKRSIQAAIDAAQGAGKSNVYVATGVYVESIDLVDGVSVYGGYSATFEVRDRTAYQTALVGEPPTVALPGTVNAFGVGDPPAEQTVVAGFSIFGEDAQGPGESSYGVYLWDAGSELILTDNVIVAADGADGADGSFGESGAGGTDGQPGTAAQNVGTECSSDEHAAGGAGGAGSCGGTETDGGAGGTRICPDAPDPDVQNEPQTSLAIEHGADGGNNDDLHGGGGEAGWDDLVRDFNGSCSVCSSSNTHAGDGANGVEGRHGDDGATAAACDDATGVIDALGMWQPNDGGAGGDGTAGGGGGGGGAGGGVDTSSTCTSIQKVVGGSGGGGGSGGCGGRGGQGGGGGGGSFGVFATWTSAPSVLPQIHDNAIFRGRGGDGGAGGHGGLAGPGGDGAPGGLSGQGTGELWLGICGNGGGFGGNGGDGGHGAGGAGGCGGVSYGLFLDLQGGAPSTMPVQDNEYPSSGSAGLAGEGGPSFGAPGPEGEDGLHAPTNF